MDTAPRKRRRWRWLLVLLALALCGWFALRFLLQPERLSRFLLQQAETATGLSFELDQPADIGFWPDLHLVLEGLTVGSPQSTTPILRGHRVEVVLPWSALSGDTLRLRELRLTPMSLDLDALFLWLESRSELGPPAPLQLPQLDAGLLVTRSRITYREWVVADLNLELTGLQAGESSVAHVSAILGGPDLRLPFNATVQFVPHQNADQIRLDPLSLISRDTPQSDPWLQASGRLAWQHPRALGFDISAELTEWPTIWPTLPLPAADAGVDSRVQVSMDYRGTPQLEGALKLHLSRADESIDATLALGALAAWIADPKAHPLPPLAGEANATRLQFNGVELRGVKLRLNEGESRDGADSDDN